VQPAILSLSASIVLLLHLLPANMVGVSNCEVAVKQERCVCVCVCVDKLAGDNSHTLLPQKVGRFPLRKLMTKHRRKVNINYLLSLNTEPLSHSAMSNQTTAQLFQACSITETLWLFLKAVSCLLSWGNKSESISSQWGWPHLYRGENPLLILQARGLTDLNGSCSSH